MIAALQIPLTHRLVALLIAAVVVVATIEMIRRRKLREEYAMLWLGTSIVLTVIAALPQIAFWVTRALGITYVTLLVLGCFSFLAMIVMHYATAISRDAEHIRQLAQQVALLKEEIATLREKSAGQSAGDPEKDAST